jgi:hypothetical protein
LCADWRQYISAGEQAVVLLIGADKKQASILRRYCYGLLQAPLLAREITRYTGDVVEFKNGSQLEIVTNDPRLIRGRSAIAVLGSECCYWRTDEYNAASDEEVVPAAVNSMAMCPDTGLLKPETGADADLAMVCDVFDRFRRIILDRLHAHDFSCSNLAEIPTQEGRCRAERESFHPGSGSRT